MLIKQISVFVENKPGRLAEITDVLGKNDIDIRALSIADTTDFGILRLIVNKPDVAIEVCKKAGFTVAITDVIAIEIEDKPGGLAFAMEVLYKSGVSVEYMYAFVCPIPNKAFVILRVDNIEKAVSSFEENKINLLNPKEIYEILA